MKNDIRVNMENLNQTERDMLLKLIEKANKGMPLSSVAIGDTFKVADIEFIHFGDGVAVAKDALFSATFGDNNNFAKSGLLNKLKNEVLPKIENAIGSDNVLEFETDLLSLDGSDKYGTLKSKISLPTFDFYRKNVKIFDKYKLSKWWWLATPDSTEDHTNDDWVVCVTPDGYLSCNRYYYDIGVRPFCRFKSSILVTC